MSTSSAGFDVAVWGPIGWAFLTFVTLNYPVRPTHQDKLNYHRFFQALAPVLPCQLCSNHFKANVASLKNDTHLASRFALTKWLFDVHNKVSASKRRPASFFGLKDMMAAVKMFECFRADSPYIASRGIVSFVPHAGWKHASTIVKSSRIVKEKQA